MNTQMNKNRSKKRKRSAKNKKSAALFRFLLMSSSLLFSLLIINLLHLTVDKLQQHRDRTTILKDETNSSVQNTSKNGQASLNERKSGQNLTNQKSSVNSTSSDQEAGSLNSSNGSTTSASSFKNSADSHPSKKNKKSTPDTVPKKDTTLVFTGDIYLSDYVTASYNQSGIQGVLSEDMQKELTQADITIANNEFPYSTRGTQAPDKQFTFRVDPSYVKILLEAGVDLVTLANNHVLDYGTDALEDTFQTLDDAGITYVGAGDSIKRASKLITKKVNGHTFGFLAASRVFPVISWNVEVAQPGVFSAYDPSKLIEAVKDAAGSCDYLCVYIHWGIERNTTPEEYQVSMAHALIDAGADAIIGAHPHVLQGIEYYNGKPIFYSLGNFIFYQNIEQTAIAKLTFTADQTVRWQLLPAGAANSRTYLTTDSAACQNFYQYIAGLSSNVSFSEDGTIMPK